MNEVKTREAKRGFYPVYSFMERELMLKCNTLRVYAILFSYTLGNAGMYYGSRKYLADTLSISVRTLHRALSELFSRGLIENTVENDGGRSGIRCTFIHESEERGEDGTPYFDGGFVFTEKQRTKALDNLVRKTYGELPENVHLAARAAIRDNLARKARAREVSEAASRITKGVSVKS